MHIIPNYYTFLKKFVKRILPLVMALFQRIKKLFRPLLDDHGIQELKKTPPTGRRRTGTDQVLKASSGSSKWR
jgi:hypothetical protein